MKARIYLPLTDYQKEKFKLRIARGYQITRYVEAGVEKLVMVKPARHRRG